MKLIFKRFLIIAILFAYFSSFLYAGSDEGMWLPLYIKQLNERKMQQMGMKLTAEDIYSINHASIKDAVLRLGDGFCTGELVSENGLVFTNHHCGYDAIAQLSTVEHDFLTNGFWAESYEKEIPIPNFSVSRLVYMRDLTGMIREQTKGLEEGFTKSLKVSSISDSIIKAATFDSHFDAEVKSFFGETEYYLLVYETFRDVRFVGAPPSSIGKFGGDTDNWMWPRHTGDFSILRVYMSPDGQPAEYNVDNIPYKPKSFFPISIKGVKENDFAMVLGYPAQTERYLTSYDIDFKLNHEQPAVIEIFGETLRIMKEDMDKNPQVRLSFASDFASINNTYKYYIGQNIGLKKYGLLNNYLAQEVEFKKWLRSDPRLKEKYGNILPKLENTYDQYIKITPGFMFMGYGLFRLNMINHIYGFTELLNDMTNKKTDDEIKIKVAELKKSSDEMFSKMYFPTEKKIFKSLLVMFYHDVKNSGELPFFKNILTKTKGRTPEDKINAYVDKIYDNTILFDKAKLDKFYDKPSKKTLSKDPSLKMLDSLINIYRESYAQTYRSVNSDLETQHGKFISALREWKTDKVFYPDANSTMRMSYGKVIPYYPRDAVYYDYKTSYLGILQKENPNDEEFIVPPKLHDLLMKKDFGRYAKNDTLYTCFLTDNDISGGNSGSPVINGDGQLIGLAFDGNWEAMTGDLMVNPKYNRTINVDIRYVLFIIDKFAGAKRLIDELKIIEPEAETKITYVKPGNVKKNVKVPNKVTRINKTKYKVSQTGLNNLKAAGDEYNDYQISDAIKISGNITIITKSNLKYFYFKKGSNGSLEDVELTDDETDRVKTLLTSGIKTGLTIKQNPNSKFNLLVVINSSNPNTTFSNKGLPSFELNGSIFILNKDEKLLYYTSDITVAGADMEMVLKKFSAKAVGKFNEWLKQK